MLPKDLVVFLEHDCRDCGQRRAFAAGYAPHASRKLGGGTTQPASIKSVSGVGYLPATEVVRS